MESYIKIKATAPEMRKFFEKDAGVRYYKIEKKQGGELCIFSVLYAAGLSGKNRNPLRL